MKNGGPSGGPSDEDFAEFLNNMFGGGIHMNGMGGGNRGKKSKDAIQEFEVSLEELFAGKHVKLMSKRKVVCSNCKGYSSSSSSLSRSSGKI